MGVGGGPADAEEEKKHLTGMGSREWKRPDRHAACPHSGLSTFPCIAQLPHLWATLAPFGNNLHQPYAARIWKERKNPAIVFQLLLASTV
jgi:hypothetical protein